MIKTISTRIASLILWMIQALLQGFISLMRLIGSATKLVEVARWRGMGNVFSPRFVTEQACKS
jgi:hypothetical protein